MSGLTDYAENLLVDALLRGAAITFPETVYVGLLTSTDGPRANSHAYLSTATISVLANDGKVHLYECTQSGTTAGAQSTLYPGVIGEVITDGGAKFTERSALMDTQGWTEASGGSYARVKTCSGSTQSLTDWKSTQGNSSVSSGIGGSSTNSNIITFPSPSAAWGYVWGMALFDSLTSGDAWVWGPLATPKTINNGDAGPSFAVGSISVTIA